jgi:hypothetical protein
MKNVLSQIQKQTQVRLKDRLKILILQNFKLKELQDQAMKLEKSGLQQPSHVITNQTFKMNIKESCNVEEELTHSEVTLNLTILRT